MTTDRGNGGVTPIELDDDPLDPDILLITSYLARELSAEQEAEVEARIMEDEAFHDKVMPYMRIWTEPGDYRKDLDVLAIERREQEVAALQLGKTWKEVPQYVPERTAAQVWTSRVFTGSKVATLIAALLLVVAGLPTLAYQVGFTNGREEELLRIDPRPKPAMPPAPTTGLPRAPMESDPRTVRVARSTFVHLRTGARFVDTPVLLGLEESIALGGEAMIEVGPLDRSVEIITRAGRVRLKPGTYALRSNGEPNLETLVTVAEGEAILEGGRVAPDLTIRTGEHGRITYPAPPQRTNGGDGYPAIGDRGRIPR